jgi:hypothetical protein
MKKKYWGILNNMNKSQKLIQICNGGPKQIPYSDFEKKHNIKLDKFNLNGKECYIKSGDVGHGQYFVGGHKTKNSGWQEGSPKETKDEVMKSLDKLTKDKEELPSKSAEPIIRHAMTGYGKK